MGTLGYTEDVSVSAVSLGSTNGTAIAMEVVASEDTYILNLNFLIRCEYAASSFNIKGVVWNSSRNVVAVANTALVNSQTESWKQTTLDTPYAISNGSTYYIGFVRDAGTGTPTLQAMYETTGDTLLVYDATNSYASPQSTDAPAYVFICSFYAETGTPASGPDFTIEGITPAYFGGVEWANIGDIW